MSVYSCMCVEKVLLLRSCIYITTVLYVYDNRRCSNIYANVDNNDTSVSYVL